MKIESIDFEITERCNFRCPHCYVRNDSLTYNEVTADQYLKIINEARELGLKRLRITGGEPLVRYNLFIKIYKYSINNGIECHFNSNISLIDKYILNLIHKDYTSIQSTLYGWDSESFETFVGVNGVFSKFLNNLHLLRGKGIKIQLRFPPIKSFLENIDKIMSLAESFECNLKPIWKLSHKVVNKTKESTDYIKKNRLDPLTAAKMRLAQDDIAMHDIRKIFFKKETPFIKTIDCADCDNPKHIVYDSRGFLLNCFDLRDKSCKVRIKENESIIEAIARLSKKISSVRIKNSQYLNRCSHCILRRACFFCPGLSYSEYGDIDTRPVEYYCQITHESAKLLGILDTHEKGWNMNYDYIKKRFFKKAGLID